LEPSACTDIDFPLVERAVDAVLPPVRQYAVGLRKSSRPAVRGWQGLRLRRRQRTMPGLQQTNPADPDDVPAMPAGFTPDLS
jgi:hypothetical protein